MSEEHAYKVATFLLDYQADALTLAAAYRILDVPGAVQPLAPVTIARLYRAGDAVGLFTQETMQRALIYLEQPESNPVLLLQKIEQTQKYFSWDRYCKLLAIKVVSSIRIEERGFEHGKALIVESNQGICEHDSVLAILADWVTTSRNQKMNRSIFQMYWGGNSDLLIYNLRKANLTYKCITKGTSQVFSDCPITKLYSQRSLSSLLAEQ